MMVNCQIFKDIVFKIKLDLKYQNQELEKSLQVRRSHVAKLSEVEDMHQHNIDALQNDIHSLYNERSELQPAAFTAVEYVICKLNHH
ncbi:MAG TPA: hypothetical protein VI278_14975 [Nitrososphaeraceae archaeon]